jgi:hypothetical protein
MIWLAGIFVVFLPLAVRAYKRAALPWRYRAGHRRPVGASRS